MGKMKIHEIAKKLGLTSKEILEILQKNGHEVKSHASNVSEEQSQLVKSGYTVDLDVDRIEQYLMSRGVNTDEMSESEIREADTGSHVFLKVSCKILDAIEDIVIDVEI